MKNLNSIILGLKKFPSS